MIPKYLKLINFMSHKETEIDFTKVPNATIIIGMEDGSLKMSNAVGKTTLFNAIYFSLFDATVGKKEKVIRDGEKKCEVEFIFEMAGIQYKIFRSRTKTTKNVYFYKLNNDNWESLGERTNSQTEEIICKVIGTSQKTFEKSSYFKQNDKFDLASTTSEKRKAIIIDMLHLHAWSVYEKKAKLIKNEIEKKVEILEKTISMIGNPDITIANNEKILSSLLNQISETETQIKNLEIQFNEKNKQHLKYLNEEEKKSFDSLDKLQEKLKLETKNYKSCLNNISKIESEIKEKTFRLESISKALASGEANIIELTAELEHINSNYPEETPDTIYSDLTNEIINYKNLITNKESYFKIFAKDIPDDEVCPTCFTELNDNKKKEIIKIKQDKLNTISIEIKELTATKEALILKKNEYDLKISEYRKYLQHKIECEKELKNQIIPNVEYAKNQKFRLEEEIKSLNDYLKTNNEIKENLLKEINVLEKKINNEQIQDYSKQVSQLIEEMSILEENIKTSKKLLLSQIYSKGGIEKTIENSKNEQIKLCGLNKDLDISKNDLLIYKEAVNAFSPYGIPAMIISTVLDSLQTEVNDVLLTLRPSIQVQFFLEKERSDGAQEDTLGMKFFVNSVEWDYETLSGGQQACVALAIKLAIAVINRKRCGSDIRLLLLDEVDQGLDQAGIEAFYNVIKKWSKDMMILIITHNEQLINMFDSYILVSKDNGSTSAKFV